DQLVVERHLSAVFHGELDHVRLRSDAVQVARLLLAKRRGEPGDRVRGGLLLRTEVCSPFGSREAPGGFPGNEGCAVAAGGGGRQSRLIPSFLGAVRRLWNSIKNYPWRKWLRSQAKFLSFLLPAAILLIVLVIYPVVATLSLSVVDPEGRFVGFQNYQRVIGS